VDFIKIRVALKRKAEMIDAPEPTARYGNLKYVDPVRCWQYFKGSPTPVWVARTCHDLGGGILSPSHGETPEEGDWFIDLMAGVGVVAREDFEREWFLQDSEKPAMVCQWISVEDRLPDPIDEDTQEIVLVYLPKVPKTFGHVHMGRHVPDVGWYINGSSSLWHPTHWMSVPQMIQEI
jgi:hypothetical protein